MGPGRTSRSAAQPNPARWCVVRTARVASAPPIDRQGHGRLPRGRPSLGGHSNDPSCCVDAAIVNRGGHSATMVPLVCHCMATPRRRAPPARMQIRHLRAVPGGAPLDSPGVPSLGKLIIASSKSYACCCPDNGGGSLQRLHGLQQAGQAGSECGRSRPQQAAPLLHFFTPSRASNSRCAEGTRCACCSHAAPPVCTSR